MAIQIIKKYPVNADRFNIPPNARYRTLADDEIQKLQSFNNQAADWRNVLVSDPFDVSLIRDCQFLGKVYLGKLQNGFLKSGQLILPVGLRNCVISNCQIGDHVALKNIAFIDNFKIGNRCMLFNIDEMTNVENSTFGNGYLLNNDAERHVIEVSNENGGRAIAPFAGMLPADAYLCTRFRDDAQLHKRLIRFTDDIKNTLFRPYGVVGDDTVIKSTRLIENAQIGSGCLIQGTNKLKNLTIHSSGDAATEIGEGVELVNGIVGFNNKIYFGVKAIDFATGRNVKLTQGARLFHTYLGPNSTISCCEVLHNLIFPFHEQHHNNSFLIATTIKGQSNIAAGATIGSNHNSRAADGEIVAERGFWPGLVSNFKHNSYFAPFTLIAKGNYYSELNITLPFSLISPTSDITAINIFPGFWFKYNLYAIARNSWKFNKRDRRIVKSQHIETDFLAPDSVSSMLKGIEQLRQAINKAAQKNYAVSEIVDLAGTIDRSLKAELDGAVNKGKALLIKPAQGIILYRMMIRYYAVKALLNSISTKNKKMRFEDLPDFIKQHYQPPAIEWENLGGQIISRDDLNNLVVDIKNKKIDSWESLHNRYDELQAAYPEQKYQHGLYCALAVEDKNIDQLDEFFLRELLEEARESATTMLKWAQNARAKDYENEFRKMVFSSDEEMRAVLGEIEDNPFLKDYNAETENYIASLDAIMP